jgi:hypothetical protein
MRTYSVNLIGQGLHSLLEQTLSVGLNGSFDARDLKSLMTSKATRLRLTASSSKADFNNRGRENRKDFSSDERLQTTSTHVIISHCLISKIST